MTSHKHLVTDVTAVPAATVMIHYTNTTHHTAVPLGNIIHSLPVSSTLKTLLVYMTNFLCLSLISSISKCETDRQIFNKRRRHNMNQKFTKQSFVICLMNVLKHNMKCWFKDAVLFLYTFLLQIFLLVYS